MVNNPHIIYKLWNIFSHRFPTFSLIIHLILLKTLFQDCDKSKETEFLVDS